MRRMVLVVRGAWSKAQHTHEDSWTGHLHYTHKQKLATGLHNDPYIFDDTRAILGVKDDHNIGQLVLWLSSGDFWLASSSDTSS